MISHRERTRRKTNEHARAEALINNKSLGTLGCCVRDAAAATHSQTCGVPDRESNEIKYLREATDLIDTWQQQLQDVQSVSWHPRTQRCVFNCALAVTHRGPVINENSKGRHFRVM